MEISFNDGVFVASSHWTLFYRSLFVKWDTVENQLMLTHVINI